MAKKDKSAKGKNKAAQTPEVVEAVKAPKGKAPAATKATKVAKRTGPDFPAYLTKTPTDLQLRLAVYLKEKTGLTFASSAEEVAFNLGARLAISMYLPFQRSPENIAAREAASAARKAGKASAKAAPAAEAAPAKKGKKGSKTATVTEPVAEVVEEAPVVVEEAVAEAPVAEAPVADAKPAAPKRAPAKRASAKTPAAAGGKKAPF
jgi:hypothetical protein